MIKVLFAGDIVGSRGCDFAEKTIRRLRSDEKIDIVARRVMQRFKPAFMELAK